ncbi:MAG: endolytic transglycosylase MltG [Holosporales bacterium]|nr:endolytic transglycosylase MltG [Holosporales bacterium]
MFFLSFFQKSDNNAHCVYLSKNSDFYQVIKKDGSYEITVPFWIVSKIPLFLGKIQAGEYLIEYHETAFSVIIKILKNRSVTRKITIPEGYTSKRIVEKLNDNKNLTGTISEIPEEASLFPSTYFYKKGESKKSIIKKMQNKMKQVIEELFVDKDDAFIKNTIILASIVEKETSIDHERPLVASVFKNRLKFNMRLQSDPTVVYAVSNRYGILNRQLLRSDWKFESPYNTYKVKGLPPSAICAPSYKSIMAVLSEISTDYLYFVASSDQKHHVFSKEYNTHVNNINYLKYSRNK